MARLGPLALSLVLSLALSLAACGPEKPPAPEAGEGSPLAGLGDKPADAAAEGPPSFSPEADQFVLTYAGERGKFADCTSVDEVPEEARAKVGVNLFGKRPPGGKVWVADLTAADDDGRIALEAVPREDFELEILGVGRYSAIDLPDKLPDIAAASGGPIVVYKTSWCGVCKQLEAYLKRKGVEYVAKDIEKDPAAAAELAAKAKQAGVPMGSVPMIDIEGELLRGFDRKRLDELL